MNIKLRLKNKTTLIAIVAATVAFLYQLAGILGIVPPISQEALMQALRQNTAGLCAAVEQKDVPAAGIPGGESGGDPRGPRSDDQQLTRSHAHPSRSQSPGRP